MKLFIEKAYAKRDSRMTSSMQVLIDCSWMVPVQVTHITEFLNNICPSQEDPHNLFVMLDFGLRSFGMNDDLGYDRLMTEIGSSINPRLAQWYNGNVSILCPNQTVFLKGSALSLHGQTKISLDPAVSMRKSMHDRCSCLQRPIDLHFGHTPHGEKCMKFYPPRKWVCPIEFDAIKLTRKRQPIEFNHVKLARTGDPINYPG